MAEEQGAKQANLEGEILKAEEEAEEPKVDIITYLQYFGLTEDPTKSRDFVHTDLVDRIIGLIKVGRSIRLLGEAGIGKSATIREIKEKLENDPEGAYVVSSLMLCSLVDPNNRFITKDGLIAISLNVLKEFDNYFIRHHKKKTISGTEEHVKALRTTSESIGASVRTFHLTEFFNKIKNKDIRTVIILDDADALQNFESFDNLNYLMGLVHSTVVSYKPAEETATKQRAVMKDKDEIHEERRARKQRQDAFWRRSTPVPIPGQPGYVLYKIMYGKISKKADLLSDEAQAYGFMAAYCGKAPAASSMDAYINGLRPNQPLYNPDKMGNFLANCLEIGYLNKVNVAPGCIDAKIAKTACTRTIANLDAYGAIDVPTLETHIEELRVAKEKFKEPASQPK